MDNAQITVVTLAAMPVGEAVRLARAAGATIGTDNAVMSDCYEELLTAWLERYCPKAANGESDEVFGDRVEKVCDEFEEGFNETFPDEPAPSRARGYKSGLHAAVAMLQSWQVRDEEGVTPDQMMSELIAGYYGRTDRARRGFADALMAWVMIVLQMGVPNVDGSWDVEHDLKYWGRDHD